MSSIHPAVRKARPKFCLDQFLLNCCLEALSCNLPYYPSFVSDKNFDHPPALSVCQQGMAKFCPDNSSVMLDRLSWKLLEILFIVSSFAPDKTFEHPMSIRHNQNFVWTIPPKRLDTLSWKLQEIFFKVPRYANRKDFDHAWSVRHSQNFVSRQFLLNSWMYWSENFRKFSLWSLDLQIGKMLTMHSQ